jgi:3,4-dihydroxy 2-butanone 4-phosphate synthase
VDISLKRLQSIEEAIAALKSGQFILIHDDKGRENEVDMVIAAEHIRPEHISTMRLSAGGLICLAISNKCAIKLGLVYMYNIMDVMAKINPLYSKLASGVSPYGDRPSFSIAVNHRDTFTGITDTDRALTISRMARVCDNIDTTGVEEFTTCFRSPGHVPILIASSGLLRERNGHTELCIYLAKLAGLVDAVTICEMLDSETYRSLSVTKAEKYAEDNNLCLLDAAQLKRYNEGIKS